MAEHNWPEILLADRSPLQLAVFADWLTEAGDPLADGVRWLAQEGKRPSVITVVGLVVWNICRSGPSNLPEAVLERMEQPRRDYQPGGQVADTYYASLLDAARAYLISLNPPPPKPPQRIKRPSGSQRPQSRGRPSGGSFRNR